MKLKTIYYIFLSLLLMSCGASQSLKKAEQSYARGEYFDAAKHFRKAYSAIPAKDRKLRGETAYKMADCYRLINYNLRAKGAYLNAIRYKYPDSIAHFYLAESLRKNGEYRTAAQAYETYLIYQPEDSLAINGLYSCQLAQALKDSPTRHSVKRMPIFFSRRSDYSPMYAGDDADILYFTSTRNEAKGNDLNGITGMKSADIFMSKRDEKGVWQKPEVIESEVNTEFEEGAATFSADGKTMYFTRCRTAPESPVYAEIYSSSRTGANWAKPVKCAIINDTLSSVAHPAPSLAGDFLYFVSDMPGGQGGLDIWRINMVKDGFGYVDNLGPEINTAGNEMFPTFGPDGTLYFSSDGHPGLGGLDIFEARYDSIRTKWEVANMGVPINSAGDDFGMTFEPKAAHRGFFSSNRGDARGWDHIYSFELPDVNHVLTGWVYDKEGDALPEAMVTLVGDDGTYLKVNVRRDGSFTQKVDPAQKYVMLASCRGYLNNKQELLTDSVEADRNYEVEFPLASISRPVLIENIFYEFDRADLTPASTQALDELIKLLNDNPNVTIELASHCDYKGDDAYNERLSQRRAESVVRYLIANGIASDRLTAKGYGEQSPKVVNKSVLRTAPFLALGDVLTEEFIMALPEDQQEVCNAINRRTEFQVLRTTYGLYK